MADFHIIAAARNLDNRITEPASRLTFISTVPLRQVYAASLLRGKDGSDKLPGQLPDWQNGVWRGWGLTMD